MVLTLAQTLPRGFANLLSASYEVEHISLAPQPGVGVSSLDRPDILNAPCSVAAAPGGNYQPSTLTECPMGSIFANGFGGKQTARLGVSGK